jgi:hypothetical protein
VGHSSRNVAFWPCNLLILTAGYPPTMLNLFWVQYFSFIIILFVFQTFFLCIHFSLKKKKIKVCKKSWFCFAFFTNFKILFLLSFFHIHSLKPIFHLFTKSCDLKVLGSLCGVKNRWPYTSGRALYMRYERQRLVVKLRLL